MYTVWFKWKNMNETQYSCIMRVMYKSQQESFGGLNIDINYVEFLLRPCIKFPWKYSKRTKPNQARILVAWKNVVVACNRYIWTDWYNVTSSILLNCTWKLSWSVSESGCQKQGMEAKTGLPTSSELCYDSFTIHWNCLKKKLLAHTQTMICICWSATLLYFIIVWAMSSWTLYIFKTCSLHRSFMWFVDNKIQDLMK
jgi:hypothetical protein